MLKALVYTLELLAVGLLIYIIILPFYPSLKYKIEYDNAEIKKEAQNLNKAKETLQSYKNNFPGADYSVSPNRLIIGKIGVNAPIVESKNSDYGLSKGSWLVPDTSTPDKGGNTVITGHRFKYLPPNNLTFYLLDKLEKDDIISVIWQEKNYYYQVMKTKIVAADDLSILKPTASSTLTLYTCDPIYSTKNRLVVIAELLDK